MATLHGHAPGLRLLYNVLPEPPREALPKGLIVRRVSQESGSNPKCHNTMHNTTQCAGPPARPIAAKSRARLSATGPGSYGGGPYRFGTNAA
ncbi:hypothetical protein Efla_005734 [Eimeria flavescens]